jgi:hypothetical protein
MQTSGTISTKLSRTFLIWGAAAVLITFTAAGAHRGFLSPVTEPVSTPPPTADRLGPVVSALQTGNAEALSHYFDAYVDLTLPDKPVGSCSKSQARMVLRDFFDTYRVKGFLVQNAVIKDNPGYCIGTLQTYGGNFRTSLFIRQDGETPVIKEIALATR